MNAMYLQDLVKGRYGRKIAYTNVESINEKNIVNVVGKAIGIHNANKTVIKYLWDYKNGDQPARYRVKTIRDDIVNHVVENHAFEIVAFKNAQTNGEPIQYVSTVKDEKISKAVDLFNKYARLSRKHRRDIDSGEWTSAVGTGFKAVCRTQNTELPFKITAPTPMNTFIIYSKATDEPMLAVQELEDENNERYLLCFDNKFEYRIKNSSLVTLATDADGVAIKKRLHMFADIPIVEYPNNQSRISDIELVIDMLDAINNMQSNRMDAIEQFVQSWVKFVNCDIDIETFNAMKMSGALSVKSNNGENKADVDIMTQELNQTETQVAKNDLWDNALSILAIPNKQGSYSSGDSQGAVELRNGWDFSKSRAKLKDQYTIDAEMRLAKVMLGVINGTKGAEKCELGFMDFEAQVTHSPTDNLMVKTQALAQMLTCGVDPKTAIETCGLWGDAEKVYLASKDTIDKKQYADNSESINVDKTVVEE